MIIFYYHAVMNTFIQWKETISDACLTDTPSYFPFIEPNISLLPPRKPHKHTKQHFDFQNNLDQATINSILSHIADT